MTRWNMTVPAPIQAALAALPLAAAGCAIHDGGAASQQSWSTRDTSVLGLAPEPVLAVTPVDAAAPAGHVADERELALGVLRAAIESDAALLRANATEALQRSPQYVDEAVRRGLADPNRGVRFVAAMTVGKLELRDLAHLIEPLLEDQSASVRAAAIFAAERCGRPVDLSPLAAMLTSGDAEVKGNAALVLGELGNRSAVPMLRTARGRGLVRAPAAQVRIVDLQIAEAMIKLGEEQELEGIRAALFVPPEQGELTALACLMCGRLGDKAVLGNLAELAGRTGDWQQSPEVRMAAATGIALMDRTRFPAEVPAGYVADPRPELRAQAAMALGAGGRLDDIPVLADMLADPAPMVQVSAAAAILQIMPE